MAQDQIDPQHCADHQSNADGGRLQDAQSAATCARRPTLCCFDEQGFCFVAKTDGPETASAVGNPASAKGTGLDHQHRQGAMRRAQYEFIPRDGEL